MCVKRSCQKNKCVLFVVQLELVGQVWVDHPHGLTDLIPEHFSPNLLSVTIFLPDEKEVDLHSFGSMILF